MAGRRNRSRRRRRRAAKVEKVSGSTSSPPPSASSSSPPPSASSSPPPSGSSSSNRKIPLPSRQQLSEDPRRRTRDARSRRPLLLSLIRGYYIDAISRLPAAELRTTLAHGLLVGGHCYGPLHPVLNIIVNSVWYAAAFPFRATNSDPIDVDVITTEGISRLVRRSVDGLLASLCHHCPALSHDDALWHLCLSGACLRGAIASARGAVPFGRTALDAVPFQVAAQAARHPNPAALTRFATSVLPAVERHVLSLLAGKRRLSLPDILHLSAMLLPFPLLDDLPQQPSPGEQGPRIVRIIAERRRCYRIWYQTLLDIADAALRKFAHHTGARYCLITTYGQSILETDECHLDRYFHINFMACPKVDPSPATEAPVRFFAEAHNPPLRNCSEDHITFCCMMIDAQPSSSHVDSCYACVIKNHEIDHPNSEEHFGGHPHRTDETVKDRDCPSTVDVDYRFFDPDRDIDLVEYYADMIARTEAICSRFRLENASVNEAAAPCPKYHRFAEDDSDDEDDCDDEDTFGEDISIYCTRYI